MIRRNSGLKLGLIALHEHRRSVSFVFFQPRAIGFFHRLGRFTDESTPARACFVALSLSLFSPLTCIRNWKITRSTRSIPRPLHCLGLLVVPRTTIIDSVDRQRCQVRCPFLKLSQACELRRFFLFNDGQFCIDFSKSSLSLRVVLYSPSFKVVMHMFFLYIYIYYIVYIFICMCFSFFFS